MNAVSCGQYNTTMDQGTTALVNFHHPSLNILALEDGDHPRELGVVSNVVFSGSEANLVEVAVTATTADVGLAIVTTTLTIITTLAIVTALAISVLTIDIIFSSFSSLSALGTGPNLYWVAADIQDIAAWLSRPEIKFWMSSFNVHVNKASNVLN